MSRRGQRMVLAALSTKAIRGAIIGMLLSFAHCPHVYATSAAAVPPEEEQGMEVVLAVKDHGFKLNDVVVLAKMDGSVAPKREGFLEAIRAVLREAAWQDFKEKLPASHYVSIKQINEADLVASYDPETLEIAIEPRPEQRPRGEIRGGTRSTVHSEALEKPALLSAYLNTYFGIGYEDFEGSPGSVQIPAITLDAAMRWRDVVLEGEAQVAADGTVSRRHTRLVYDVPDEAIRLSAGDIDLRPYGSLSTPPLFGVAIEKTYSQLQPNRNIRPTGRRSFRLERHSEVLIMVNDREVRRLNLAPGEFDLDDLPLATGHNDVQIRIRDELGKEEFIDFSILFNRTLLMPGVSEWSLAGGLKAEAAPEAPYYNPDIPIFSGQFRHGISETFTGSFMAQGSLDASLIGLSGLLQTGYGLWNINTFSSISPEGDLGWSVTSDFSFDTDQLWEELGNLSVGIDIEQNGFFSSLSQTTGKADRIRFTGSLSHPLPMEFTANLSGYYQLAKEDVNSSFGTSLSLSRVIDNALSLNLSGSYERSGGSYRDGAKDKINLLARLNYRPSTDSYFSLQHDRNSGKTAVSTGTHFSDGDMRTSVDADFENIPQDDGDAAKRTGSVTVNHSNGRVEVNASHGVQFDHLGRRVYSKRSFANFGTAIGYADGNIAIGQPVRGGFAILSPHKSLSESQVKAGVYKDSHRAGSDGLGPLLVSDISAYTPSNLTYDVEDAPLGYDTGTGAFQFLAPYKAGYSLSVGSEFSITAMGTLLDDANEPLSLKAVLISLQGKEGKKVQSFTNKSGLFTGLGLKAGRWIITIPEKPLLAYQLDVPEDASGFYESGTLTPIEKQ